MRLKELLALSTAVGFVACPSAAVGQQQFPANGLLVNADVGSAANGRTLLSVATATGDLRTVRFARGSADVVVGLPRASRGKTVGSISLGTTATYTLRAPQRWSKRMVLLDRRGIQVAARQLKNGWDLVVTGIPSGTSAIDLELRGPGGAIVRGRKCPARYVVRATASRTEGGSATSGSRSSCG